MRHEIPGIWSGTLQSRPKIPKTCPGIHETRLIAEIPDTRPEFLGASSGLKPLEYFKSLKSLNSDLKFLKYLKSLNSLNTT